MSEPDDSAKRFLRRWSRRKRTQQSNRDAAPAPSRERMGAETNAASDATASGEAVQPAFDPATLPPIESITAMSDVRAFLAPGVPDELTRAALRRVWVTDPTIRDFVGLAENQWDFTKPDGVPGFGSLELTPELRRMVAGMFGKAPEQTTLQRQADAAPVEQFAELSEKTTAPGDDKGEPSEHSRDGPPVSSERAHPDSALVPSQRNNDAAAQKHVGDSASPRLAHRKHGGAVPK